MGDANHFATAQRFALPTVIQMTALRAFLPSVSHLYILTQTLLIQIIQPTGIRNNLYWEASAFEARRSSFRIDVAGMSAHDRL